MKKIHNPSTKYPMVYIEWDDAYASSLWLSENSLKGWGKDSWIVHEMGWLIENSKDRIVLASRYASDKEDQWGMTQKIPKTWVKIHVIAPPSK